MEKVKHIFLNSQYLVRESAICFLQGESLFCLFSFFGEVGSFCYCCYFHFLERSEVFFVCYFLFLERSEVCATFRSTGNRRKHQEISSQETQKRLRNTIFHK